MVLQTPVQSSAVLLFARIYDGDNISPHMQVVFIHALQYVLEKYGAILLDDGSSHILAAFNVPIQIPLPAYVAMKCANEMQQVFNGLRREMLGGGIKLAIGINRGPIDLQNIDSEAVHLTEYVAEQSLTGEIAVSGGIYEEIKAVGDQFNLVKHEKKTLPDSTETITLYHFMLPDTTQEVTRNLKSIIRNSPTGGESRVLIAEDAPSLRSLFAKVLKNAGFDVHIAVNGHDVIAQLEEQLPDVLVLDLGMPGISGEDVIRYVQQRHDVKRVKIVVVTGNHLASQSELADQVDLMLIKPVSPRDLVNFVKRFI
ncbi:MAG: response regulator [Anaerolineae bacterium]|nr:response regulator [Anaerolineae bacterium]